MSQDFHRWRRFTLEDSPFDPTTAAAHYPPDLGLEPIHLNIDLTIDIAAQRAAGVVTHTVVARRAQMRTLTLDAVDLTVSAIVDADGRELTWRNDGKTLAIRWDTPFAAGEERRVAIHYAAERPASGLYFS